MQILAAIALPILAGLMLILWRPRDRKMRQKFVVGSACLTSVVSIWAGLIL